MYCHYYRISAEVADVFRVAADTIHAHTHCLCVSLSHTHCNYYCITNEVSDVFRERLQGCDAVIALPGGIAPTKLN